MAENIISIELPAHFSFKQCLIFLNRNKNECLHFIEGDKLHKALHTNGADVIFSVSEHKGKLKAVIENIEKPSKQILSFIKDYITDWLDLETDLTLFYKTAENDKILKQLIENYKGLRLIGIPDLFETMVWCVMGQQINLNFAYSLKRKFVERYGRVINFKNRVYYIFPLPQDISRVNPAELKELQLTGKKSEYIVGIASAVAAGELTKEMLMNETPENIKEKLIRLRGVGEWTAEYVMMKCLKICSAFPAGDVGLQNAVKNILKLEKKPAPDELRKMSRKWKACEAYAVFYLWRSLLAN